jgi:hypothetical protein
MRRVCFLAVLTLFASTSSRVEASACAVNFRHEVVRCHHRPQGPSGESALEKAKREAQKIIDDAKREAENTKASAQRDADNLRASAQRDAENLRASAQRDADNIKTKAMQDADNIKASALREKQEAQTLMAAAVATQKAAAEQIDQANHSKQDFDNKTQELKDKIKEAEDAKRKAGEAQTVFEEATRNLEADRKQLVDRFDKILRTEGKGNCCQTKERCP